MSKPMDAKELKKVIDASIYPPFLRKEAKDFVDGLVAEVEAHRGTLAAAREGWEILAIADVEDGWILVAPQFVTKYRKALTAALPNEPRTEAG